MNTKQQQGLELNNPPSFASFEWASISNKGFEAKSSHRLHQYPDTLAIVSKHTKSVQKLAQSEEGDEIGSINEQSSIEIDPNVVFFATDSRDSYTASNNIMESREPTARFQNNSGKKKEAGKDKIEAQKRAKQSNSYVKSTVFSRNAVVAKTQMSQKAHIARPDAYLVKPKNDKGSKVGMHLRLPPVSKTSRNQSHDATAKKHSVTTNS